MNKTEFIKAVAEKSGTSVKQSSEFFEATVAVVAEALKAGEKVNLTGFGAYELKSKCQREGINPKTKEKVLIPACKAPAFKFSKAFKDSFN